MDFEMNIGESLDFNFEIGSSSHTETSLLVGSAEIFADGIKGISGVANKIEDIFEED